MPTVLVIDDDAQLRKLLRSVLQSAGYQVSEACDGREGVQAVQFHPPDLVLCDIFMGEQDGLVTILKLRREFPTLKVIAMSGGGALVPASFLDEARIFGAVATLSKPFSPDTLLATVRRVLGPA